MSQPSTIDGFEFAAAGATLAGRCPVQDLPRLQASLVGSGGVDHGELAYALQGTQDALGRRALRLTVSGTLQLSCQRCLEPMPFPLALDATLVLAASDSEIDADANDLFAPDRVLARREMAVGELIEDEVLLAIPFAPRHERCAQRIDAENARGESPFAGLSALLDAPARAGRRRGH